MFSKKEKQLIAAEIEKLLLSIKHPEMPLERPKFHLMVYGAEEWSFAEIQPNWVYEAQGSPKNQNGWNEIARNILDKNVPPIS